MKKLIISLLICCMAVLTACSKADTAVESSPAIEVPTVAVTEQSVNQTQSPTESETEAPTESVFPDNFTEIPENASYKQIKYTNYPDGFQDISIHFFDSHDNVILIVTDHNGGFGKTEYSYEYNEDGTVAERQYQVIDGGVFKTVYEYNTDGTLAKKNDYVNGEFYGTDTYTYDGHKEPVRRESAVPDEDYYGTSDYSYEYDQQGRVIKKIFSSDLPVFYAKETYTYDYKGNLKTIISGKIDNLKIVYSYDEDNRLIMEDHFCNDSWEYSIKYVYEFY